MVDDIQYFAPVAEYRNVCVLEKRGEKRAVWQGQEYLTDGKAYVAYRDEATDVRGAFGFENEGDAKIFIDVFHDAPDTIDPKFHKRLLNYKEVYEALHHTPYIGEVPTYIFSEADGVFVRAKGAPDGQHRHGGLK